MNKKELQNRVYELEQELLEAKISKAKVIEKHTFFAENRKLRTFSGRPKNDGDPSIDDWIDDLDIAFSARGRTDAQKVDLIYNHLEGQAKEEIKFRADIRHDPEAILECLRSAFGNPESIITLQQRFFERQQRESETIREYSYVLLELYQAVIKKDNTVFPDKERTLCERFVNGLHDKYMRKEAKRLFRRKFDKIDFYHLRDEMILLSEEEEFESTQVSPCETKKTSDRPQSVISDHPSLNTKSSDAPSTDDLLKIIQAQQKQIDSLTGYMKDSENKQQTMERHTTQTPIDRFTNPNESSTERRSNQYPMDRQAFNRSVYCYGCGRQGHIQKNCRATAYRNNGSENK